MKSKYVICGGLAFLEKNDMKKLSNYAKEGWILERIVVGGFFYKLRKDKPKDIIYSLDYQNEANEEYIDMFLEAGWTKVLSICGKAHIFSAQEGTKPIYSERESELEKYTTAKSTFKKGSIYSFISLVVLILLAVVLKDSFKVVRIITKLLAMVNFVFFVFNFMPYVAYIYREKNMRDGRDTNEWRSLNLIVCMLFVSYTAIFLWASVEYIVKEKYFCAMIFAIGSMGMAITSIKCYKRNILKSK